MKLFLLTAACLLVLPTLTAAQTSVSPGQVLTATWATLDCSHVCDQPSGAGVRVVIDGTVVQDLGIPTIPLILDIPLPTTGPHTIALEAYNCNGGCQGVAPPPPVPPPAPVLTVSSPEQAERGLPSPFRVR